MHLIALLVCNDSINISLTNEEFVQKGEELVELEYFCEIKKT